MLRKLTEFAECTGTSKAYRDTYLRTPKSGYTGIPVISRTPTMRFVVICLMLLHVAAAPQQVLLKPDLCFH